MNHLVTIVTRKKCGWGVNCPSKYSIDKLPNIWQASWTSNLALEYLALITLCMIIDRHHHNQPLLPGILLSAPPTELAHVQCVEGKHIRHFKYIKPIEDDNTLLRNLKSAQTVFVFSRDKFSFCDRGVFFGYSRRRKHFRGTLTSLKRIQCKRWLFIIGKSLKNPQWPWSSRVDSLSSWTEKYE